MIGRAFAIGTLIALGACASSNMPRFTTSAAPGFDVSKLQTYSWAFDGVQQGVNPILFQSIRDEIDTALAAKGFKKVEGDSDFIVGGGRRMVSGLGPASGLGMVVQLSPGRCADGDPGLAGHRHVRRPDEAAHLARGGDEGPDEQRGLARACFERGQRPHWEVRRNARGLSDAGRAPGWQQRRGQIGPGAFQGRRRGEVVPGGRIELPTLRFSVVCSTN